MAGTSERQIEANRRNASRSTGPRTAEGKERSRRNGLRHGFAAGVVVPEEDRAAFEAELARWDREAGPDNVFEEHLVRRAAVGSVGLDRMDAAREQARQASSREAVRRWEEKKRHAARRKAQEIGRDPGGVVADLEGGAFGCEWLIRQWERLDAPLRVGQPWDQRAVDAAQRLLGFPAGVPGIDAEPVVRRPWLLAGAMAPGPIATLPRAESEANLPTEPVAARSALRGFIAEQVGRLQGLRDESWEAVEGPEREAVAIQAAAADTSAEGQSRHRYARDADRSCNAAIRLYLNIRDRRRRMFLEIAKEGNRCDIPRIAVGGGWWREVESDPAPPGCARIGSRQERAGLDRLAPDPDPVAEAEVGPCLATVPADTAPAADVAPEPTAATGPGAAPSDRPRDEPTADRGPIATEDAPIAPHRPADRRAELPGAPRRSEPISPAAEREEWDRKTNHLIALRNESRANPPGAPRRTGPSPVPDRPVRSPADRGAPGTQSSPPRMRPGQWQ